MSATTTHPSSKFYDAGDHHPESSTFLGFWIYLMSDCLLFAVLFATFAVLGHSYAAGPSGADLFNLPLVAVNTTLLLFSSMTYGFAMLAMLGKRQKQMIGWLLVTALLGMGFVSLEIHEFIELIHDEAGPGRSAFLSSFFTLVGTHGLHVSFGIVWLLTLVVQISRHGLTAANKRRLVCLSMFWHFLDLIWIGVFSFVYLMGVLR